MSSNTLAALDPVKLRREADEARAEAHRLLDLADEYAIRAELAKKLAGAKLALVMAERRTGSARSHLSEVAAEAESATADQRQRAERVRTALASELGGDLADQVSGRLAAAAAVREADQRRVEVAENLAHAGAPAAVVDAALAALDEREAAEQRDLQARLSQAKADLSAAEVSEDAAAGEIARLEAAIEDPLNLGHFEVCDAWLGRITRPEIFRHLIAERVNQTGIVPDEAYALAIMAARESGQLYLALAGEWDQIQAERAELVKAQTELDRLKRAARVTPTATTVSNGVSGWL